MLKTEYLGLESLELEKDKGMSARTFLEIFSGTGSNNLGKIDRNAKSVADEIKKIRESPATVFINAIEETEGFYTATVPSISSQTPDLINNGIYILKLNEENKSVNPTIKINGRITKELRKIITANKISILSALEIGDLKSNFEYIFRFDGTYLVLIGSDAQTLNDKRVSDFVLKSEVVDSTISDSTNIPLSAKQGKILDNKIDTIKINLEMVMANNKTAIEKTVADNKIASDLIVNANKTDINTKVDGIKTTTDKLILDNKTATDAELAKKAPLISPTFTGVVNVPTAIESTSTTQAASTEFVSTAISSLVGTAPATLNTLNELAKALGDDPNFATTVTAQIGKKVDKVQGKSLISDSEITRLTTLNNYDDTAVKKQIADETTNRTAADSTNLQTAKTYTDNKIAAIPVPDVSGQISTHNTAIAAHESKFAGKADKESTYTKTETDNLFNGKENSFSKNTAFNKNFGTASGTVCEGSDVRLSDARNAKDVSTWAKEVNRPSYTAVDVGALPIAGGTITGNLTLKGGGNFGNKINFGDGDYVHISEPTDDVLELKGATIKMLNSGTEVVKIESNTLSVMNEKIATEKYVNDKIGTSKEYTAVINVDSNTGVSLTGCNVIVNGGKYPITGASDSVTVAGVPGTVLNISFDNKADYIKPSPISYTITPDVLTKVLNAQYIRDIAYIDVNLSSANGASIVGKRITVGGESKVAQSAITRFDVKSNTSYTISVEEWAGSTKPDNKSVTTGSVGTVTNVDMQYKQYFIFGIAIDESNSNSLTAVTYTDDAVGMTKGSSSWDSKPIFNEIKPCVLLNPSGTVNYYLNPNNFAQRSNGSSADIESGSGGDVMIEFKKFACMIYRLNTTLYVKITNNPNAKSFDTRYGYNAFSWDNEGDANTIYVGAYLGYELSGKIRSLSNKTPTANQTIGVNISKCAANGTGYVLMPFYVTTMLQCLYLIKYGSLNSQDAVGIGWTNKSAVTATGGANSRGMCYGDTSGNQMKLFGIEDFWGNLRCWIGGLYCDSGYNILTAYKNFNNSGSGYRNVGHSGATSDTGGWVSKPQGGTSTGFIPSAYSGSGTTYYADYGYLSASRLPCFGGVWGSGAGAGAFRLDVVCSAADANSNIGARLCFIKK